MLITAPTTICHNMCPSRTLSSGNMVGGLYTWDLVESRKTTNEKTKVNKVITTPTKGRMLTSLV